LSWTIHPPQTQPTTNLECGSEENISNIPSPSFDKSKQCLQHLTHPYIAPKGILTPTWMYRAPSIEIRALLKILHHKGITWKPSYLKKKFIMDGGYFSLKSRNLFIHSFTTLFQNPQQYLILSLYQIANHKLGFGATYQECQGHSKSKKNGKCNHSLQPFALIETLIFILVECLILFI
jgi:hypothetical protein